MITTKSAAFYRYQARRFDDDLAILSSIIGCFFLRFLLCTECSSKFDLAQFAHNYMENKEKMAIVTFIERLRFFVT
ncbi:hypothetical protein BZG78_02050 [Salinivibrio sp. MA351]|uniref:hypothetical protein n=1 Tax=Salinivibrio sp. MA351 TaxID=1909453 RepID=UPI000988DA16|nr:hypothetical protein [Salinivibrio sp. MA351]OOF01153.1 hypothetical protein BZG78_02050 [Salinivibrio sp. MA351]